MKKKCSAVMLVVCVLASGCSTKNLSMSERANWNQLVDQKVVSTPIPFKSTKKTVVWDVILPGSGSIYAGGGKSWGWIIGGILLWPASMVYQPFIGQKIARNESQRRTIEYYKFGSHAEKLEKLKAKGKLPADFKSKEEACVAF